MSRYDRSCATWERLQNELVAAHRGRWAVIVEDRLVQVVDDAEEGLRIASSAATVEPDDQGFIVKAIRPDADAFVPYFMLA